MVSNYLIHVHHHDMTDNPDHRIIIATARELPTM